MVLRSAPGLVFAVLAILTLREPRSQLSRDARAAANASNHIPLLMVFSALEQRPTFWLFAMGGALTSFVSYAHGQFFTPFFLRNHATELTVLAAPTSSMALRSASRHWASLGRLALGL